MSRLTAAADYSKLSLAAAGMSLPSVDGVDGVLHGTASSRSV